ncbi:hypothetical protein PCNPT3_03645 [Psychromonas sp. CNPT3]|uniref:YraN family protein n=1 Tax=Psychromonas sp. CNPT3 TaxID=314282 RepID=UPI00006E42AA|nr:YraN family protein [Psychromonas sp. CNPT3]AGH80671.1 hypothetical protein PCNPT3_03645 [Psychromonas sp. CNPT3]
MTYLRRRQPSNAKGNKAEQQALLYLQEQGLVLLYRNYYCSYGEIDLIMRDKQTLVFIEVRYRKNNAFGGALASISPSKQRKIIATAAFFLAKQQNEYDCRFDAVAIDDSATSPQWIQGAFQA